VLLFVTIDLADADIAVYEDYESSVLPLLGDHRGALIARWRVELPTPIEYHLIEFADQAGFDGYMTDERRLAVRAIWEKSGARSQVVDARPI